MAKFFINRPIVALVISILMVMVGIVAMVRLPIAQYPNIVPPEILLTATYPGADALTVEQSVATPIEQQMSGVDNMNLHVLDQPDQRQPDASARELRRRHGPEYRSDADQPALHAGRSRSFPATSSTSASRWSSAPSRWACSCCTPRTEPMTTLFLANYAFINLTDQLTRVRGIAQVQRVRSRPVRDALLGQAGSTGEARHHRARDRQRSPRPEHRESGGHRRRRADAGGAGVHLLCARARPPGERRRVREHRVRVPIPTAPRAAPGRGAHRARRAELLPRQAGLNGRPSAIRRSTSCPARTRSKQRRAAKKLMAELKERFPKDLDYGSRSTRRWPSPKASKRSSRRSSRRSRW